MKLVLGQIGLHESILLEISIVPAWQQSEEARQRCEEAWQQSEEARQRCKEEAWQQSEEEWQLYAWLGYHEARPEEAIQRYNELLERICRVFNLLSTIWQKLLDSLLFFCNFSGFPHKYRPPCRTMPWNIWPSLVVLWGVCWMFYNHLSPIGDAELQAIEADTSNEFTGQHQLQHSFSLNEPAWENFSAPLYLESLDPLHAHDTLPASIVGEVTSQYPATADPFSVSDLPSGPELALSLEALRGSLDGYSDQVLMSFPDITVGPLEGVGQTYFNNQHTTSITEGHQNNGHAQVLTPLAMVGSASQIEQITVPPCQSTTYKRTKEPPRNTEGMIVCSHSECSNLTFTRRCDWNKHMDKHERPYRCTIDGCDNARGFASKGDFVRHNRNVHKLYGGGASMLFCDEPDCPRGPGGGTTGFSRKDNLADHMRRKHDRTSTASARVIGPVGNANNMILPSVGLESPRRIGIGLATSPQRKRRRMPEMALSSQSEDLEDMEEMNLRQELKRMRQVERDLGNELTKMKRREEELIQELKEAQRSLFSGMDIFDGYELGKM